MKNKNKELYNKIQKSNNKKEAIIDYEKKIYKKIKDFSEKNGVTGKNGFLRKKLFIWTSMLRLLNSLKENTFNSEVDLINPAELYEKLIKIKSQK
jgi:hypothetical protein